MVFTIGNIITLAIVACFLVLYRLTDKSFRSVEKVKKYADKCKEEIAAYADEKCRAVKNYGIDLEVERKAASQLMKDIQEYSNEELAKKSETISRIDGHIRQFEASLNELFGMTDRVQENLSRIRDESVFVENTSKRVSEAKDKFEHLEKALETAGRALHETEARLEKKNAETLEHLATEVISSAKTFVADFETTAQVIERKVEEHRLAVNKIERDRESNLNRDIEQTKKHLKEVFDSAAKRADKLEETAFVKLREQAHERVTSIKTFVEEKIKSSQETLKTEQAAINEKLKTIHQDWTKGSSELDNTIKKQRKELETGILSSKEEWRNLCKDTEQNIINTNEKRLDEFSKSNTEAIKQLHNLADDAAKLENELRKSMHEATTRVKKDFSEFEKESSISMETTAGAFDMQAKVLRKELDEMNKELNSIRQQAYDNVSEKLSAFEIEFTSELGKRASETGRQIADWQAGILERFVNSEEKIVSDWQQAEERIFADQRKGVTSIGEKLTSDLDRLKQETSAFEMGIREEMRSVDEARVSFSQQLRTDMSEARVYAEAEVTSQIGQYQLDMQEILRTKQRELEKELEKISALCSDEYSAIDETARNTRQSIEDWQTQYMSRMREMDGSLEKLGRQSRETASEYEERISSFRTNLEDIRKELSAQKKIFEQTGDLRVDLDRRMEETNANLNRLDQRKGEISQLENQLNHVKRLEDEVNNKMTRFLSENRRIELMEESFNRLVKTSVEVENKLKSVSTSNDVLQAEQFKIRKLEEALKETEEKYLRIEKKNEVMEETTEGIDRNFKSLNKTEAAIKNAERIITALSDQFDRLHKSIESLAAENEKATDAMEKITILDDSLTQVEKRISDMNVAREWLANTETRLTELNKEARETLKLTKDLFDRKGGKKTATEEGAPPPQHRDNIRRLWDAGWKVEEIASAMGISRGEVELVIELFSHG